MCDLIGFFAECDFDLSHPSHPKEPDTEYRSAFIHWDTSCSAHVSPFDMRSVEKTVFPLELVPVASHSMVNTLEREKISDLQFAALYRFMNFTHNLEILVVNPVTANIAMGRYDFILPVEMQHDAHRIYIDEAYHAFYSFQLMTKMKSSAKNKSMLRERTPAFIFNLKRLIDPHPRNKRALLELFFVIASEMLITTTLRDAHRIDDFDAGVRGLLSDHAKDESRHYVFYRDFLRMIWLQIEKSDRQLVLHHLPKFLIIYTSPDFLCMEEELVRVGISASNAQQVLAETYPRSKIVSYAEKCGEGLSKHLKSICTEDEYSIYRNGFREAF